MQTLQLPRGSPSPPGSLRAAVQHHLRSPPLTRSSASALGTIDSLAHKPGVGID